MAYRRSIIARTKLFYQQQQRFAPSFSHISSRDREEQPPKSICRNSQFLISRNYGSNPLLSGGNATRLMRSEVPVARYGYGLNFRRNLSNVPLDGAIGVEAAAPVVNEVAVAAADSFFPVAALQYLIDYVHCYTGLEWWASIAATTLLIRFISLPSLLFVTRFIDSLTMDLPAMREAQRTRDYTKYRNQFSDLDNKVFGYAMTYVNGCLLFFAILNMVEKVPSFTTGGTLWFTDLTTPNVVHLQILLALTFWFRLKLEPKFYPLGGPTYHSVFFTVALLSGGAAAAELPAAIYCYGITSNLFSIAFGKAVTYPRVRKLLKLRAVVKNENC